MEGVGSRKQISQEVVFMGKNKQLVIVTILVIAGIAWFAYSIKLDSQMGAVPKVSGGSMRQSTPIIAGLVVPSFSPVEALGERNFNENCAACHGENASGNEGAGPPLAHIIYEPNHHGDMSFQLAVKNGVRAHHWPFGNMPPLPNVLEGEVTNIIAYIRALQRANGIN